jgi:hypothetical protein
MVSVWARQGGGGRSNLTVAAARVTPITQVSATLPCALHLTDLIPVLPTWWRALQVHGRGRHGGGGFVAGGVPTGYPSGGRGPRDIDARHRERQKRTARSRETYAMPRANGQAERAPAVSMNTKHCFSNLTVLDSALWRVFVVWRASATTRGVGAMLHSPVTPPPLPLRPPLPFCTDSDE